MFAFVKYIIPDAFGVDRIDYLLRDSYHAGVSYGRFDHHRLLDTLRILPGSPTSDGVSTSEPTLGVEHGGLHSAEALALARYFMYSQVYFHPVRRAYDIHLKDFMKAWLPGGLYPADLNGHLALTDNEVWSGIADTTAQSNPNCAIHAARIVGRDHFRVLYRRNPNDINRNPRSCELVYESAVGKFGQKNVAYDQYVPGNGGLEFPVLMPDNRIASSVSLSETLRKIPVAKFEYVFVDHSLVEDANKWLTENRDKIIQKITVEEDT